MREPEITVVHRRRWFVWRDIVTVFLAIAVLLLVFTVRDLQTQLSQASALRTKQLSSLQSQLDDLQHRLGVAQQQSAAKDARIRQLTDQLLDAGLTPVPAATVPSSTRPRPTPTPEPAPSATTASSPSPRPSPTSTPSPSPSPRRTCLPQPLDVVCLLPADQESPSRDETTSPPAGLLVVPLLGAAGAGVLIRRRLRS